MVSKKPTKPKKTVSLKKEDLKDFRMYRDQFPKIHDLVVAEVTRIEDTGIYLKLLEYENLEGLMMLCELSKRRWRTVSKLVQISKKVIVMVMRVDQEKGYVDLSKKRVSSHERTKFIDRFKNTNKVHSIFKQVCAKCNFDIKELYESFGWRLYDDFPHAIDGLETLNKDPSEFFEKYSVPEIIQPYLKETVQRRLAHKPKKIRAHILLTCYNESGVRSIREALKEAEKFSTEKCPLKVRLVSSPKYSLDSVVMDSECGIENMENAIEAISKRITESRGRMVVDMKPTVDEETESEEEEIGYFDE